MVSQIDRVAKRFHRQGVFLKPLIAVKVRNRTQAQDEMVVLQFVMMVLLAVRDPNRFCIQIYTLDFAVEDLYALQQFSNRAYDVRDVQIARGDLMKHRRKEEKVFPVDQSY